MSSVLHDVRISADGLAYALADGRNLFTDLTLGFGRERTGLVGANGVGKSTLLRTLASDPAPPAGSVARPGARARAPPRGSRRGRGAGGRLPQAFQVEARRPLADVLGIAERLAALDRILA